MKRKKTSPSRKKKVGRVVRSVAHLSPLDFENLIFDFLILKGMVNVNWRTPGADGGRDIEGLIGVTDFSGAQIVQKWFIECKRYKASVDWPTIYKKMAYADSCEADVFLLCTTSKVSPAAIDEIEKWNDSKRAPVIRVWPRHELELQLQQYPELLAKYKIGSSVSVSSKSLRSLALTLSKIVSTHYSKLIFEGIEPDLMLQAAQALSDFIQRRLEDLERYKNIRPIPLNRVEIDLQSCIFTSNKYTVDGPGLIAIATYLAALTKAVVKIQDRAGICVLSSDGNLVKMIRRYRELFSSIAVWSNFEIKTVGKLLEIEQRK